MTDVMMRMYQEHDQDKTDKRGRLDHQRCQVMCVLVTWVTPWTKYTLLNVLLSLQKKGEKKTVAKRITFYLFSCPTSQVTLSFCTLVLFTVVLYF